MNTTAYEQRRSQIEHYFDRTAADAWARLTSNEPVGRIRATVRAGRDTMRETLLSWLPQDLRGLRVLERLGVPVQLREHGAEVAAAARRGGLADGRRVRGRADGPGCCGIRPSLSTAAVISGTTGATPRILPSLSFSTRKDRSSSVSLPVAQTLAIAVRCHVRLCDLPREGG
jgi:hypothetical protein